MSGEMTGCEMPPTVVLIAVALWVAAGVLQAVREWRRGDYDYNFDSFSMAHVPTGVGDRIVFASMVVLCGPLMLIGELLGKINDRTSSAASSRNTEANSPVRERG